MLFYLFPRKYKSTNERTDERYHSRCSSDDSGREAFISEAFSQMQYTTQRPIVFMFSGQGSHYYQMGKELFRQSPIFQQWMIRLDDRVQALTGESVVHELYESQKRIS